MIPFAELKAGTYRNLALMAIGVLWEFMFNVGVRHRCAIPSWSACRSLVYLIKNSIQSVDLKKVRWESTYI